jgi:hypothetical protein
VRGGQASGRRVGRRAVGSQGPGRQGSGAAAWREAAASREEATPSLGSLTA